MSKYIIFIPVIFSFLFSSCNILSNKSEVTEDIISSEIQIPGKNLSSQKYNCDSLDNGVTFDNISKFSYQGELDSNSSENIVFVTCLDDIELKIVEKNMGSYVQSLLFIQKESLDTKPFYEISKITRLPFYWPISEGENKYIHYDNYKDRFYILVYREDLELLHVLELDPSSVEQSKIVYSFTEAIHIIEKVQTNWQELTNGFYFEGLINNETWVNNSENLSFFSFEQLKEIPLWKVIRHAIGQYNQEQVLYYIKGPNLRIWEITNFRPRRIELELFRYIPSKNKSELLKKIPVFTKYQEIDNPWNHQGEYPDIDYNFWLISGEAVYLGKKIIF